MVLSHQDRDKYMVYLSYDLTGVTGMRILVLLFLLCLTSPLRAQETRSFHIDLTLQRTRECPGVTPPTLLRQDHYRLVHCQATWQSEKDSEPVWETHTTAWYAFSSTKYLGIELNFATDKNTTLKLRGRRILFEWRW
jgi:hypothetical protein